MSKRNKLGIVAAIILAVLLGLAIFQYGKGPQTENADSSTATQASIPPVEGAEYDGKIKIGHVAGVCMSPLFYAHDQGLFAEQGIVTELVWTANPGDGMNMLDGGDLKIVHGPFTTVLRAADQGVDLKIISGSGNGGIFCIAQPELSVYSMEDLKHRKGDKKLTVGSSRVNTLEMTWYGLISDHGMTYDDFDMRFFPDYFSMTAAFENKEIDVITHVEPYASQITDEFDGIRLGGSADTWGPNPPDCVVSVRADFLEKYPGTIRRYLRAILEADARIKANMDSAAELLVDGGYYKVHLETLKAALPRQPPGVELRPDAFDKATEDMLELEYLKKKPEGLVDISLLEEVIRERKAEEVSENREAG